MDLILNESTQLGDYLRDDHLAALSNVEGFHFLVKEGEHFGRMEWIVAQDADCVCQYQSLVCRRRPSARVHGLHVLQQTRLDGVRRWDELAADLDAPFLFRVLQGDEQFEQLINSNNRFIGLK